MTPQAGKPLTLSKSTLTPLGNLIFAIGLASSAAWWASSIVNRLERIEAALNKAATDTLTRQQFDLWLLMFARDNPTLKVTDGPR